MTDKNWGMITCMKEYGGSFVKVLAALFARADSSNYQKLRNAFPEYCDEYSEMAGAREENRQGNER